MVTLFRNVVLVTTPCRGTNMRPARGTDSTEAEHRSSSSFSRAAALVCHVVHSVLLLLCVAGAGVAGHMGWWVRVCGGRGVVPRARAAARLAFSLLRHSSLVAVGSRHTRDYHHFSHCAVCPAARLCLPVAHGRHIRNTTYPEGANACTTYVEMPVEMTLGRLRASLRRHTGLYLLGP